MIMKNCLVISDLSYLQDSNEGTLTGGHVSAGGYTLTDVDRGSADAVAGAYAFGDSTYTNTGTETVVRDLGFVNYSSASATATSRAYSENQSASYKSSSSSISLEFSYG